MKIFLANGPLCPYHRGKGISPRLSEKCPNVVSVVEVSLLIFSLPGTCFNFLPEK